MTPSQYRLAVLFVAASLAMIAGCQVQQPIPGPEPVSTTPILVDPAMQARNWDPSVANYQSDLVMAWPDYAPLKSKSKPMWETPFTETGLFIGNTFYLPYGMCVDDLPTKMIAYKSMNMEPTFTAMPPLPPSTQPSPSDTLSQ